MSFFLGKQVETRTAVDYPVDALHRHLMAIGASGSGKTVLCKCLMEEAIRNNIPCVIVDPQGDISSLALKGDPQELERHGIPLTMQEEFFEKARVAIFTPASSKGISISVNPLSFPSADTPHEEVILALDMTATSLASFLGYDLASDAGKGAKAYLFTILEHLWRKGETIKDMGHMAEIVVKPPAEIVDILQSFVTKKEPPEIARKLRFLTVGTPSLMFQKGVQIDMDMFMDRSDGKVPLNIIYMNTLSSTNDKQFFLATLMRELYCWMLKNPSEDIQLLFYVDEIAPYIPPYPRNPPPKEAYAFLFKQARKYGVGLVAATQNITDIDYKALAQVNTWCLGRLMTQQDIARVKQIIQSIDPVHAENVLQKLPSLKTGEFLILSPDVYEDVVNFQVRWLVTNHLTLDEQDISSCVTEETKQFFERYLPQPQKPPKKTVQLMIVPQVVTKTLNERIELLLNSVRQSVSAEYIAENLNVPIGDVEKELANLVKSKTVTKSRSKDDQEQLYWLSKFGFDPAKNVVGEVLAIPTRLTQVDAFKKGKSELEGGFFSKDEAFYDATFCHIPIWKVSGTRKAKHLFFFSREEMDTFYLSATTGAFVSLENGLMVFHKLVTKSAEKLKTFDDDYDITFIPRLPKEVPRIPKIKLGKNKIYSTLRLTLGVQPLSSEIVLLPVWTLKIKHKKTKKKRSIVLDAATGRKLVGEYKPKKRTTKTKTRKQ
ncbi:MAG: helicase HerA-like domain-containing protein [Candidatus Bathyarchaeia archaeon]